MIEDSTEAVGGCVDQFNELEGKIKRVVEEYALLKGIIQELEQKLEEKREELEAANGKIAFLNEERNAVRGKVDLLLGILDDIDIPQ